MVDFGHEYYIMGQGALGRYLHTYFSKNTSMRFLGFIDNNSNSVSTLRPQDVQDKSVMVFIGSINYMYEMEFQLKSLGFEKVISFARLTSCFPDLMTFNQSYNHLQENYTQNKDKYEKLRSMLCDEKSVKVLDTLIEYRKTLETSLYHSINDGLNRQYFEDFVPPFNVFIDGGGFDGDSAIRFINKKRNCKIYFFEPDSVSFEKAKNKFSRNSRIKMYPYALSDKECFVRFNSNGSLGAAVSDNGNSFVKCVALDDIVEDDYALIKLDVEGFELNALKGAVKFLKNNSPLMICVYHKPEDIYQIPEFILSVNDKYKFYLRHYTNSIFETVLYAIIDKEAK